VRRTLLARRALTACVHNGNVPLSEIKLIRHGQSVANTGEKKPQDCGDHSIELTPLGWQQAIAAGERVGAQYLENNCLVYCSPYTRTRQTLEGLLKGANLARENVVIREDPRLREVEFGYDQASLEQQESIREKHGWFYYRFRGGESPADCFDRTSSFLESMMRQVVRKDSERVLIVTHGLAIRCFVTRFLHLSVEVFDSLDNPTNGDVITLALRERCLGDEVGNVISNVGRWSLSGIRLRPEYVKKLEGKKQSPSTTSNTSPNNPVIATVGRQVIING